MQERTYSRGRDAARAAKKAGCGPDEFKTVKVGNKYKWERIGVSTPPPAPSTSSQLPQTPSTQTKPHGSRAIRFSFADIGITIGTVITSTFFQEGKPAETAKVAGDRHIIFRDKHHTLSSAALLLARETGRKWPRIQGPLYWTYQGHKLGDLRAEKGA